MSRVLVVVAALLAAVVLADSEISVAFKADTNLTDAEASFSYRYQNSMVIPIPGIVSAILPLPDAVYVWSSASVDADASSSAKAKADAMVALAIPASNVFFPLAVIAYAQGKASVNFDISKTLTNMFIDKSFSGTFDGGMMAMAALSLEEYTPDGKYVDGTFYTLADTCYASEVKEKEGVHGLTCTQESKGTKVIITYLTSENAGILKYGETPVSPRSIEMIIEVQDFKLTDKKNHARLNIGLVSASGSGDIDGAMKSIKKDGEQVYVAASTHAVVNNERVEVDVSVKSGSMGDTSEKYYKNFEAVMKVTLGGKVSADIAHVDFPAGATSFIYDPAAGSGSNIYEAGASTIALSLFAVVACVLLYLF